MYLSYNVRMVYAFWVVDARSVLLSSLGKEPGYLSTLVYTSVHLATLHGGPVLVSHNGRPLLKA